MLPEEPTTRLHERLIDTFYVDAMLLADEARSYFDEGGRIERESLAPMTRVAFSCESLKVTTRLMHVIAWLLTQRAVHAGELSPQQALEPSRRLGEAPVTEAGLLDVLPHQARALEELAAARAGALAPEYPPLTRALAAARAGIEAQTRRADAIAARLR